jgi:hypothetical protein
MTQPEPAYVLPAPYHEVARENEAAQTTLANESVLPGTWNEKEDAAETNSLRSDLPNYSAGDTAPKYIATTSGSPLNPTNQLVFDAPYIHTPDPKVALYFIPLSFTAETIPTLRLKRLPTSITTFPPPNPQDIAAPLFECVKQDGLGASTYTIVNVEAQLRRQQGLDDPNRKDLVPWNGRMRFGLYGSRGTFAYEVWANKGPADGAPLSHTRSASSNPEASSSASSSSGGIAASLFSSNEKKIMKFDGEKFILCKDVGNGIEKDVTVAKVPPAHKSNGQIQFKDGFYERREVRDLVILGWCMVLRKTGRGALRGRRGIIGSISGF